MIKFYCEKCGQRYMTEEYFPEELECKKCGAKVSIPSTYKPDPLTFPEVVKPEKTKEVVSTSTAIGKRMLGQETEQALPVSKRPEADEKTPEAKKPLSLSIAPSTIKKTSKYTKVLSHRLSSDVEESNPEPEKASSVKNPPPVSKKPEAEKTPSLKMPSPAGEKKPEAAKAPSLKMPSPAGKKKPEAAKAPSLKIPSTVGKKKPEVEKTPSPQMPPPVKKNSSEPSHKMPPPVKKNSSEQKTEDNPETPAGICPNCGAELQSVNAVICIECGHNLKLGVNVNTLKKAKVAGKLGLAIGVGATAALLSGGIWAGIAVSIGMEIGWIACLVGLITGAAVCLVTPERSARMGALAVALACVGLLTGKMLTAEYLIRDTFKSFENMTKKFSEANKEMGKQLQDMLLLGVLANEMQENGEISNSATEELKKLAPKSGEKPSKEYLAAWEKVGQESKQNMAKVKKKFATLSAADKARLQKKLERLALLVPLQQEMIDNGEITKPDEKWKDLVPKSSKEKPSKEYLAATKKYSMEVAENMKKVKKKLYALSDTEVERLKGKLGSSVSSHISYWQKLKVVSSYWDILWFLLAISSAWGLGSGTSKFSRQGL